MQEEVTGKSGKKYYYDRKTLKLKPRTYEDLKLTKRQDESFDDAIERLIRSDLEKKEEINQNSGTPKFSNEIKAFLQPFGLNENNLPQLVQGFLEAKKWEHKADRARAYPINKTRVLNTLIYTSGVIIFLIFALPYLLKLLEVIL
jgi:predicted CopG family antitoxin